MKVLGYEYQLLVHDRESESAGGANQKRCITHCSMQNILHVSTEVQKWEFQLFRFFYRNHFTVFFPGEKGRMERVRGCPGSLTGSDYPKT